jgi:hypothetical protein
MQTKFNINDYISQSLITMDNDNYLDIFEELEEYFRPDNPSEFNSLIPKNNLYIPALKIENYHNSSSNNLSTLDNSSDNFPINTNIKDIQSILSFPKNQLLIFSNTEPKIYQHPPSSSIDAYHIWKNANIPKKSSIQNIELLLLDWAHTYASLEIIQNKITKISWYLINNTKCTSTWSGFIHWIICSSIAK